MILIIALVYIANQKVIYQFDARNQQKDDWQGLSDFFDCEQFKYLGQTSDDHGISRLFLDLESHQQYRIDALVLNIDGLNDPQFYLDNILENPDLESSVSSMKYCEDPTPEIFHNITIIRQHSRRSLWMRIKLHYGGLLSLNLSIIQCQYGCVGCIQVDPIHCLKWKLHQYSFNQKLIRNYDGWNEKLDNENDIYCGFLQYVKFDIINYFTQLPPHQDLLIKFFKKDDGIIIIDYIYGQQMTTNQQDNQVEIFIKNHPDPILQLILRNQDPSKQSSIRDFELFYTQPEIMFPNFYEGCQDFIFDQCLKCQKGWIEDEYFFSCHPVCGDKIIQGQEECDDGNQISKDGCFECQFSCTDFCTKCIFGICYQCEDGFLINIKHTCDPVCGDGILIPYSVEQCEIFEDNNQSGCINCKYSTINNCKNVYISQCLECQSGYYSQGYGCNPYCGDGIVLKQFEDCDDGNQVPFDGCYECKYQCIEGCNICDQGQCILKCDLEYEFVNNNCLSICGDKIVTKEEECDDGNTIQFDGCFNCKYSCPLNCFECYQGICLKCNYEYQLLNTNQCKKYLNCGDGLLQLEEECDDGNDQIADGCMDCMIEQNWVCSTILTNSPTQCSFVKYPDLIIDYLNMTQNKQYISIRFSQQIKIYTLQPLSETITFDLLNVEKKKWNSKLSIIQDVGSFVSVGEYVLEIDVLQLLEYRPVMKILINQTVANNDNAVLINHLKQIILQYPKFLDDKQKDYSQMFTNLNKYLIFALSGITGLYLLFGSGELFFEVLTILQFQQFLRYINLPFPLNLEIYFSINDLLTIQPFLNYINYFHIFKLIDIYEYSIYSEGKFVSYKQNSNLIINLSFQIIQCFMFLLIIIILKWIKYGVYNCLFCSKCFEYMQQLSLYLNTTIVFKISQAIYNFCLNLFQLEQLISYKGFQKVLLLNSWDVLFKVLLYSRNVQIINWIDIIQISFLSIIVVLYGGIMLNVCNYQLKFKFSVMRMNNNQKLAILHLFRQGFFLLFLIYVQKSQILQLGLLILTSIFQIISIYYYRDAIKKSNFIVQMVVEISVIIFMLSSISYIQEFDSYFYEEKKRQYQVGFRW